MIIRVAIFISLVALFYNYCNDENSYRNMRDANDINMMEVPSELSPIYNYNSSPTAYTLKDSSIYFISTSKIQSDLFPVIENKLSQN